MQRFTDFYAAMNGGSSVTPTGLGYIPMVIERRGAVNAPTTSTASAPRAAHLPRARSTTRPPTWWSPSCCSWNRRIPDKDISLYINSPGGSVYAGWPSTTRCSSSSRTCPPCAPAWRPAWARSCWRGQEARHASQLPHHDSPAPRRPGPGLRHPDPGPRNPDLRERLNRILPKTPASLSNASPWTRNVTTSCPPKMRYRMDWSTR